MAKNIDDLAEFEAFFNEVPRKLRELVLSGATPEDIRKATATLREARIAAIALTDPDAKTALAAIKDMTDRDEGKAKETKEISHRLGRLPEEEIDAVILSQLEDIENIE